MLVDPIIKR